MSREHKGSIIILGAALSILLTGCHTTPSGHSAQAGTESAASHADPQTQCLPPNASVTRYSPPELYLSAGQCLKQNRLDEAVFLFGTAGSEGRFDTHRVADVTAHQLASFMGVMFMKHVGEEAYGKFSAHMREQLKDDRARRAFCNRLSQLPPPVYHPQYMINHGMAAFTSAGDQQVLRPLEDPRQTWRASVNEYMDCKP